MWSVLAAFLLALGQGSATPIAPIAPGSYAGVDACRPCHKDKVDTYVRTAHRRTSQQAGPTSVLGDFTPPANRMNTSRPDLFFTLEKRADGFYQTSTKGTATRSERFDIVTGSGRKGQTYLYWRGDALYQLPISLWTAQKAWVNGPGRPDGGADFDTPVGARCLECHGTYAEALPGAPNRYNRDSLELGITCEKCHGPAKAHIALRSRGAKAGAALAPGEHDVVNTGRLSRDRQVELCATCHAANATPVAPAFSYRPGEPIDQYFRITNTSARRVASDVHASQVGLLKSSRCYRASEMTCSTCHNVHVEQRDTSSFAARCLTCHKVQECGEFQKAGRRIAARCIDCHMPNERSGVISVAAGATRFAPEVRTHAIKVYPDESDAVLKTLVK